MQFPEQVPHIPDIYDSIAIDVDMAIQTIQNTTVKISFSLTLVSPDDFSFGGGKASMNAPPNYRSKLMQLIVSLFCG